MRFATVFLRTVVIWYVYLFSFSHRSKNATYYYLKSIFSGVSYDTQGTNFVFAFTPSPLGPNYQGPSYLATVTNLNNQNATIMTNSSFGLFRPKSVAIPGNQSIDVSSWELQP